MNWKVILSVALSCATAFAAEEPITTVAGELRTHATIHSIGIEWDITGDSNHNATCTVRFRKEGTGAWRPALNLFRTDYYGWYKSRKVLAKRPYNMFAGSILFLEPGAGYEVILDLEDPDGSAETKRFNLRMRDWPRKPARARTRHVIPGDGGGRGTKEDPFRGVAAANEAARPGDVMLLHEGRYGAPALSASGQAGRYIVWQATGEGVPVFEAMRITASHVWLEGVSFLNRHKGTFALRAEGAGKDVVLTRNRFDGYGYAITCDPASRDWTITDNVIVGDYPPGHKPPRTEFSGEGVDLGHSEGHVVAWNSICHVADGVSYADRDCDIFGNDIFDTSDDGLEPDYGYSNVRMWGNRITNSKHFHFSFQPMLCGPWYIIRNLCTGRGNPFKFNGPVDQFFLAHNTFVSTRPFYSAQVLLNSYARNNLFIVAADPWPVWTAKPWKEKDVGVYMLPNNFEPIYKTDVDYDGFDWGNGPTAFHWNGQKYPDVKSFSAATGLQRHGRGVAKEDIFLAYSDPAKYLELRPGSNAVDAGQVVPNVNEDFAGKAPDLGAFEVGRPLPHYGPRDPGTAEKGETFWVAPVVETIANRKPLAEPEDAPVLLETASVPTNRTSPGE